MDSNRLGVQARQHTEKSSDATKSKVSSSDTKVPSATPDRYAALQRKLELLEKVHADAKKSYQADLERLKSEVQRTHKINSEHSDRIDKLKRQNDAQDARIQELKKTTLTDQAEIKDLRVKLRLAEQERTQLASKQGEAGDTKKALHNLEARRREQLRERDRQIAELGKAFASEKKAREATETKLQEANGRGDREVRESRASAQALQVEVKQARAGTEQVQATLATVRAEAAHREEELVTQLESLRTLLTRVTEQYGRLASTTTSRTIYDQLKSEHSSSQLRIFRLERKLANSEGQVTQLATLIRQTQESNELLAARLRDADQERAFQESSSVDSAAYMRLLDPAVPALAEDLHAVREDLRKFELEVDGLCASTTQFSARYYRGFSRELLYAFRVATDDWDKDSLQAQAQANELETVKTARDVVLGDVQTLRTEFQATQRQLADLTVSVESAKARETALMQKLEAADSKSREDVTAHQRVLQKEKEVTQRHATNAQKHKMAEEALRAEVEMLTAELTDAERYQEAYFNLVDEVGALAARNDLAEGEAERLSKFNAEIISHNNPAQRIMYLDRIRRELAETKQTLLAITRERDAAVARGDDLRNELAMYVAVPTELKPKTNITRVTRIPLAMQSLNVKSASIALRADFAKFESMDVMDMSGEMTLDELT